MKNLTKFLFILIGAPFLVACAEAPWYQNQTAAATAKLRVMSTLGGNTSFASKPLLTCSYDPRGSRLGWFHPSGDESYQASRRGFGHRVQMPGGEGLPAHMYSEYIIDASQPFYVWVTNMGATGGGVVAGPGIYVPSYSQSLSAAGFTPAEGQAYEIRYSIEGARPTLQLFQFKETESGGLSRQRLQFDLGTLPCTQ